MPKLLRSSETSGCGATIELDSKEVVYVSMAQSGVIVRLFDLRGGFVKSMISNFTGPLPYNEKNVYKNLQTSLQLKLTFPQQLQNSISRTRYYQRSRTRSGIALPLQG